MTVPGIEKNIGSLVENAAARFGDKTVLHFHHDDRSFTYQQLHTQVNQYAGVLQQAGISQGDHLAVMLPNCPEFFLVWLAVARIGAVIVPLNTRYQVEDLEYVLNDSDATGLIIDTEFAPVFRTAQAKTPNVATVFSVGSGAEDLGADITLLAPEMSSHFTGSNPSLEDLMSIQYTSGTTGFPKGCLLPHEYWLTLGFVASENMVEGDRFLCVEPFYYMDPPWELIMCMLKGMTMVATRSYSPSGFMPLVRQYDITVSWALLPFWILKQPASPQDTEHNLRLLLAGAIPKAIHKPFEERFNVALREGYGMTEIGPGIVMSVEDAHMSGSGSVGVPSAYRTVKIVNEDGQEVPPGETGELWVTGPGMFKGYYKKEEATAEAFDGEWFKTGDLFRQDESGYFYIVGRIKDMIKRAGDNIAASEVESVLLTHPGILSAAVVAVPDPDRKEEVKAYIRLDEGETPESVSPKVIIEFCNSKLADFKVPRYIEYKSDFPVTPTGKIRKAILLQEKQDLTADCFDRLADR
ncbi:MAG: acyl--CoA ligase [Deltaproteobacteria bacterium]|jgi:carnitine-CoA ligase|nr:acyl--CoA ligase [Deltaproteobacteria bacterium]MBT4641411.1 acyl--CoA ligase [Deltaproteobacteria bacterium]MBT6502392.1 acyl--CoA ligase [Deltaproteobacteria bacterium]MBT6613756.1 acyl--CoA ligase [Deltaproteobacteria bacterium]MBT7152959.1 acyl--CoA ligase [Deltaproteobacteria bacterium]